MERFAKKGVCKYRANVYILMGIEAQTDVHYAMPVKTMIYDALNYGEQVNEAKKSHRKNKITGLQMSFCQGLHLMIS